MMLLLSFIVLVSVVIYWYYMSILTPAMEASRIEAARVQSAIAGGWGAPGNVTNVTVGNVTLEIRITDVSCSPAPCDIKPV